MDTVTLVDNRIDEGQKLIDRLATAGIVVRAACWVKPFVEDRWSLYIATASVGKMGLKGAYDEIMPVLRSIESSWVTISDITLVGEKHAMVEDARDILRRFPHNTPIQAPRPLLWGMPIEEIYVYPMGKTPVPIYGMVFSGEPSGVLHLSFEPHSPHSRMEVGVGDRKSVYEGKTGIDWLVAAPEGASLEHHPFGPTKLVWDWHGRRVESSANEVWSLANLELHGFRFLRKPG